MGLWGLEWTAELGLAWPSAHRVGLRAKHRPRAHGAVAVASKLEAEAHASGSAPRFGAPASRLACAQLPATLLGYSCLASP